MPVAQRSSAPIVHRHGDRLVGIERGTAGHVPADDDDLPGAVVSGVVERFDLGDAVDVAGPQVAPALGTRAGPAEIIRRNVDRQRRGALGCDEGEMLARIDAGEGGVVVQQQRAHPESRRIDAGTDARQAVLSTRQRTVAGGALAGAQRGVHNRRTLRLARRYRCRRPAPDRCNRSGRGRCTARRPYRRRSR
jgi:hypothetical protein